MLEEQVILYFIAKIATRVAMSFDIAVIAMPITFIVAFDKLVVAIIIISIATKIGTQ